ncbi:hypothetical protein AEY54_07320 [Helicobacter pylori]|nr:hypothetical protein AEY54_07320 [Helicobacter pylori]
MRLSFFKLIVATMPPFNICYIIQEREKSRGLIKKKRLYFDWIKLSLAPTRSLLLDYKKY